MGQGSFEKIKDLTAFQSFPTNYMHIAHQHAQDGCYVLGLSFRFVKLLLLLSIRNSSAFFVHARTYITCMRVTP